MINELPEYYIKWLSTLDTEDPISYLGKDWYLYDIDELKENVTVDANTLPAFRQLELLLRTQLEVTGKTPIAVDEALNCITIGETNGDPLFVDMSKKETLWQYHIDGGDIEKISESLKDFIDNSTVES